MVAHAGHLDLFPMAAVSNYPNLLAQNNTNALSGSSRGQKSETSFSGLNTRCQQAALFLKAPGKNPFPFILQLLEATLIAWFVVPSSIFKVSNGESSLCQIPIML